MTTTPYDARRSMRIREASERAYHLAHIIKDYPNHRKDGSQFGASQLDRIEKILAVTTAMVTEMVDAEHDQLLEQMNWEKRDEELGVSVGFKVSADSAGVRVVEQTIPQSLLDRIAAREECD